MVQKTMTYIVLILLLGAGFLLGGLFGGGLIGGFAAPVGHKAVIDSMTITDTRINLELTPKLADSGNRKWNEGFPLSVIFTNQKEYPQSTWLWQRYGDTDVAMTIWGPDDTGETYYVEAAMLGGGPFEIKIDGVTKLTMQQVEFAPGVWTGCYEFEVPVK